MKPILFILVLFVSKLVLAEGYSDQRLSDRIERMEQDLTTMQKEFYRKSSGHHSDVANPELAVSIEARLSSLEEQIRHLNGKVEEASHSDEQVLKKFENLQKDTDFRLEEIKEKIEIIEKSKDEAKDHAKGIEAKPQEKKQFSEKEVSDQYEAAFAIVKEGNYEKAEIALKEFISEFGTHSLAGNAYYWLGETYLALGNKDSAALNFLYSYKKFPKGGKASNSLYKLGVTLAKIGKKKEACDSLTKLLDSYPKLHIELKTGAVSEMKQLGCGAKKVEQKKAAPQAVKE